jgi:lipid-binding SYLF domain-containing protein
MASLSTVSQAETGSIRVEFTKAGFIVGVGGGRGILTFRGRNYPFRVSGMSLGATIGASTNKLVGRALNMRAPGDLAGTYSAIGAGWPAAPGVAAAKRKGSDSSVARRQGRRGIVGQRGWCRDHYGVTQAPV